jgi:hypothetical protein
MSISILAFHPAQKVTIVKIETEKSNGSLPRSLVRQALLDANRLAWQA